MEQMKRQKSVAPSTALGNLQQIHDFLQIARDANDETLRLGERFGEETERHHASEQNESEFRIGTASRGPARLHYLVENERLDRKHGIAG
jgi:hypothetical protein